MSRYSFFLAEESLIRPKEQHQETSDTIPPPPFLSANSNSTNNVTTDGMNGMARIDSELESYIGALSVKEDSSETDLFENELDVYNTLSPQMLVQTLFSTLTPEQIESILEQNNYNIDATMDSLLGTDGDRKESRPVCRHFLNGDCYRSDCWYSHLPVMALCKFWLKGRCYKGDQCEFSHGQGTDQMYLPTEAQSAQTAHQAPPPTLDDFPALGGQTKSPAPKKIDLWAPSVNYSDQARKAPVISVEQSRISVLVNKQRKTGVTDVDWVATGDSLSSSYQAHRGVAIETALHRNKLFQKATEAYLSGNKAAARAFSLKANQLNEQVSLLHSEAAKSIFNERNTKLFSSNGEAVVDLHALHPLEAIGLLDDSIKTLTAKRYKGRLIIVTGTGHHSRGRVKVLPAIRAHLESGGWKPKEASLSDGKGGMLVICFT